MSYKNEIISLETFKQVFSSNNYADIELSNGKNPSIVFENGECLKALAPSTMWYQRLNIVKNSIEELGFNVEKNENFGKIYYYFESEIIRSKFLHLIGFPEMEYMEEKRKAKAKAAKERRELLKSGKTTIRKFKDEINERIKNGELFNKYEREQNVVKCYKFCSLDKIIGSYRGPSFTIITTDGNETTYKSEDFISDDDYNKAYGYVYSFTSIYSN